MKISTILVTGATFGALALTVLPASAAVLSVAQVTNGCPDIDQARDCPGLAEEFLSTRPMSAVSDGQIVSLVLAIAELSQVPRVSMPVCLNAADGLRVLAGGVSSPEQQTQIEDIADSLCDGTNTAAIRRGLSDANSLSSAGGAGDGGGGGNTGGNGGSGGGGGNGGGGGGGDPGGDDDDGDDGNNGHGNDDGHHDGSNPGQGGGGGGDNDGDDDHDNGHGNDSGHHDDSNVGKKPN
jgi:uncharacterized membrane protein YgcG